MPAERTRFALRTPNLMMMESHMKKLILTLGTLTGGLMALGLVNVGLVNVGSAGFGPAIAAEEATKEMDFVKVDANADGKVSVEEAAAAGWVWTPEQFAAADRDSDGSLSADEFVTATKA
jgi:EF hand